MSTNDKQTRVGDTAKGEYVRFRDHDAAPVWIRGHFDRPTRRYSLTAADDANREIFRKADCPCFIGFTY